MKKAAYYFFGFIVIMVVTAITAEIVLGLYFLYKDRNIEAEHVKDYPYLYYIFDQKQGDYNIDGFKTKYTVEKPDSIYRIILIGGSVARGKEPEQSIAAYLEKMLKQKLNHKNIEVINAGNSGYVVQQEFILTQLVLQKYKPDMIIGLDGYNDMLSYKIDRFTNSENELPPHNWQHFRFIKEQKFKNKWYSRFSAPFYNINRAKDFFIRKQHESNYNWNNVTNEKAEKYATAYWNVVEDHQALCNAKGIVYCNFLQPVRFYNRQSEPDDAEQKALSKIYKAMEKHYERKDFAYSLVPAFHKCKGMFTDDCHITAEGNQILAAAIAVKVADKIRLR